MRTIQTHRFAKVLLSVLSLAYGCIAPAQNISVSPRQRLFPNTGIGTTSDPMTVDVWNNQSGTLTISGIQVSPPFAQTDDCGSSLPPNGKCTLSITFTPTAKKYYSSTLVITDSAGNYRQWPRDQVKLEIEDKLTGHRALLPKYTDADIHNLTAYLVTLK